MDDASQTKPKRSNIAKKEPLINKEISNSISHKEKLNIVKPTRERMKLEYISILIVVGNNNTILYHKGKH